MNEHARHRWFPFFALIAALGAPGSALADKNSTATVVAGAAMLGGGGGAIVYGAAGDDGVFEQHPRLAIPPGIGMAAIGLDLMITGLVMGRVGTTELSDPANLRPWQRAVVARSLAVPSTIVGGIFGVLGSMFLTFNLSCYDPPPGFAWVATPATGFSLYALGVLSAIDGEQGLAVLAGSEPALPARPGSLLFGVGVASLISGGASLLNFLPVYPAMFYCYRRDEGDIRTSLVVVSASYVAGGIAMMVAGKAVRNRANSGDTVARRLDHGRVQRLLVLPFADPSRASAGLALHGVFR